MKTKRTREHAARTTISMPPALMRRALHNQQQMSFGTFSHYIQDLIRRTAPTAHGR